MHYRITETDVLHIVPESAPEDRTHLSKLATTFFGLTHVPANSAQDHEARRFCVLSAVRVMAEMRHLIRSRGL
jgi:hypothetical protein